MPAPDTPRRQSRCHVAQRAPLGVTRPVCDAAPILRRHQPAPPPTLRRHQLRRHQPCAPPTLRPPPTCAAPTCAHNPAAATNPAPPQVAPVNSHSLLGRHSGQPLCRAGGAVSARAGSEPEREPASPSDPRWRGVVTSTHRTAFSAPLLGCLGTRIGALAPEGRNSVAECGRVLRSVAAARQLSVKYPATRTGGGRSVIGTVPTPVVLECLRVNDAVDARRREAPKTANLLI